MEQGCHSRAVVATPGIQLVSRLQQVAHGRVVHVFTTVAVQGAGAQVVAGGDGAEGEDAAEELGLDRFTVGVCADGAALHVSLPSYCFRGVVALQDRPAFAALAGQDRSAGPPGPSE